MVDYKEVFATEIYTCIKNEYPETSNNIADITKLLELPRDKSKGDYAFPCFGLSKILKKSPQDIAQTLAKQLSALVNKKAQVSSEGPYINFKIHSDELAQNILPEIVAGNWTAASSVRNERAMVEYSQPNTHKAFHVGHTRCASLGDTLIRLLTWSGYDVVAANYIGDEGTHVAKCLWMLTQVGEDQVPDKNRGEYLGTLYSEATRLLDVSEFSKISSLDIVCVDVLSVLKHPKKPEWDVVRVYDGERERTIVTATPGAVVGSKCAIAKPGVKIAGRAISVAEREGILSEGMFLTEEELGLSSYKETLLILEPTTLPGTELADIYAKTPGRKVASEIRKRMREVSEVLRNLESGEHATHELWLKTKTWSMNEFKEVYNWLNCRFDNYFFESEFGEEGKKLVREFLEKGVFVESDGAIGADLKDEKYGFCILIKSDGTATYACRDLALAKKKFEQFAIDKSIYVVDSGQTLHFQQVFSCLRKMGYSQADKCQHFGYAIVTLPDGKMSSRKGTVILLSKLQETIIAKLKNEYLNEYLGTWPEEEIEKASHILAVATIRYGMLKYENDSPVVFDLDEWSGRSGNTGPYLLYAYARIQSIVREFEHRHIVHQDSKVDFSLLNHSHERDVLVHLLQYRNIISSAAERCAPHFVTNYLYELCKLYNRMYAECSVLNATSFELSQARLTLIKSINKVLSEGLALLGIGTLERM
jgi:arginyl-tRNA synthetase